MLKSSPASLRRLELEYPIPTLEAEALMPSGRVRWSRKSATSCHTARSPGRSTNSPGDNTGLLIAEIEISDEHHRIELPQWIGPEITGQRQYYNGSLVLRPFALWAPSRRNPPTASKKPPWLKHDPEVGTGSRKDHASMKFMIRKSGHRFSYGVMSSMKFMIRKSGHRFSDGIMLQLNS